MANLIYTHGLRQLNQKVADIESVSLIRELRRKTPLPIAEESLRNYLMEFFVSETDANLINSSLGKIPGVRAEVERLLQSGDPTFEGFNLQRAITMLDSLPLPLAENLRFAGEIFAWQESAVKEISSTLSLVQRGTPDARSVVNAKLGEFFGRMLRNEDLCFNGNGIVTEEQIKTAADLEESLKNGFLFHFTVEEELKKFKFNDIKHRIPPEKLALSERLTEMVADIRNGVDRAYDVNMRMVKWALVLYAYVKWLVR